MKAEVMITTFTGGQEAIYFQSAVFEKDMKNTENQVVNLYPEITYETFEGFGGAITDSAAYVYSLMDQQQKESMLRDYFESGNMNYSVLRVPIDSCDFSLEPYEASSDGMHFSYGRQEKYIVPMLKDVEKIAGRPLEIMLSPWSPPAYMKTNEKRQRGGKLIEKYYKDYAEYICKYILRFRNQGFNVRRVSLQNEANAAQKWDSCVYSASEERKFLVEAFYPALQKNHLADVEIYIWDHNKERLYERAVETLDEEASKIVSGIAFHWYSGDHFETMDLVRSRFPDKKLILSESCLEYSKFDQTDVTNGIFALLHEIIGDLNHGMCMFHDWNLCLDEQGGPNYVGNYCHAPYLFHTGKKRLLRQPTRSCFYHFSHFLVPGSVRIGHSKYTKDIEMASYMNPDGTQIVIFANKTNKQIPIVLRENGRIATITLLPESIATCTIK